MQMLSIRLLAKRCVLSILLLACSLLSLAQSTGVRGLVKDAAGQPLPGASVILEGTKRGTVTDANGGYLINIAPGTYTVIVSYVGVVTQKQSVTVNSSGLTEANFTTENSGDLNRVVVVGSRSATVRSSTQTPAPVDVITARDLQATGQVEPTQMLNVIAPSFNSSRQTIADGTDHIDPATLRGLGPDQVLVLVNGKRRYNTALLNVNGTIGRGSVGTDLNAIPPSSIERIEVLRDGASSQYGSDAIGGVVNVVLKKAAAGTTLNLHAGQYYKGDGGTLSAGLSHGMKLGKEGYLNLSGDFRHRDASNRAGDYTGRVYTNNVAQDEDLIAQRGFSRKNNMLVGNSEINNGGFVVNLGGPVSKNLQFFGTGSMNFREGKAAGFYRYPRQTTQVIAELYPDGFLPYIYSSIRDKSAIVGVEGKFGQGWNWDLSQTAGGNSFEFDIKNTNNASQYAQGAKAQTEFYAGKLGFNQYTTNLNFSRDFGSRIGLKSFNVAAGAELRFDNYLIEAGEEASYKNYDPSSGRVGGAQVFPGFQPANAVNETRNVYGVYADLESDITNKFLVNVAGRFEDYSDYGSNMAGKLAMRYKLLDALSVRGSISNGFRAPSMHQRYFSAISTVFISNGSGLQPFQQGTFRNNSKVAGAFGVPSLEAETSTNYSLGFTSKLAKNKVSITIDGYQIDIKNRIVLSSSFRRFSSPESNAVNTILNQYPELSDVSSVIFFTNAIDTRTSGVDFVTSFSDKVGKGQITFTLAGNVNETKVQGEPRVSTITDPTLQARLFARDERGRYEGAQPKDKFSLGVSYRVSNLTLNYRTTRYGKVYTLDPTNVALDEFFDPKFVTDVSASYRFRNFLTFTLGANNVGDVYPDRLKNVANTNSGIFVYSRNATQFGFSGGYYFTSVSMDLHNIRSARKMK
ncbi:MAG: TonB-dependent receptor [Flaviaesturariibacter sp.]|nr:TonB-dependent receptor [Flaviaesturariibacter sp.]